MTDQGLDGWRNIPVTLKMPGTGILRCAGPPCKLDSMANVSTIRWSRKISQAPGTHCTRKSPLPLLPSGPGGVGGNTSRGTDA